jgi:predicted nucleic acid-binding protein
VTVVFDTNLSIMLVRPDGMVAMDAKKQIISHAKERVDGLVAQLAADKNKIVIPTPVLAELLVRSDPNDRAGLIARFSRSAHFRVEDFDQRAAIELADIEKRALDGGDKRDGVQGPWTKVRFDRQIVAIAIVVGANTIYTDDGNLAAHAFKRGIRAVSIGSLPIPAAAAQISLVLEEQPRRKIDLDLVDHAEPQAAEPAVLDSST